MANILKIKRRVNSGGATAGAPASLAGGELAYNEVGNVLYYGAGSDGSGNATSIFPIAGTGAFLPLTGTASASTNITFSGTTSFTGTVSGSALSSYVSAFRLDQFALPTADISHNGYKITNLADPTNPQDAATKAYVDAARSGLDVKDSCRVATTASITLSGLQTIDGITLSSGDRVLVKDQTTSSQNGIYTAASSSWTRATDFDSSAEVTSGAFVFVEAGSSNAGKGYVLTTLNPISVGTTPLTFTQFSEAGAITVGASGGLTYTNNTLTINTDGTSISINASNQLRIHTGYTGQTSITTLGTITQGTWNGSVVSGTYGGLGVAISTLTDGGLLKRSGSTVAVATAGTDYLNPNSTVDGGTF